MSIDFFTLAGCICTTEQEEFWMRNCKQQIGSGLHDIIFYDSINKYDFLNNFDLFIYEQTVNWDKPELIVSSHVNICDLKDIQETWMSGDWDSAYAKLLGGEENFKKIKLSSPIVEISYDQVPIVHEISITVENAIRN